MSTPANPTWYDVLGVSPDSTPDQIKAAWRDATDKFEPGSGSGQFRMFNEAADVLLDPPRRAAYDESLGGGQRPVNLGKDTVEAVRAPDAELMDEAPPSELMDQAPPSELTDQAPPSEPTEEAQASRMSAVLTLVLALLTILALVAAGYFGLKVRTDARVAEARDQAPATAERAAKAILEYDYRRLPADRKRASVYLTPEFRKKYLANFTLLEKQKDGTPGAAVQTKTVVTASVLGSGVMNAEADIVRVLVYVNQDSRKPGVDPQVFQNRVAMTMKKVGNRWLVDDLKSY